MAHDNIDLVPGPKNTQETIRDTIREAGGAATPDDLKQQEQQQEQEQDRDSDRTVSRVDTSNNDNREQSTDTVQADSGGTDNVEFEDISEPDPSPSAEREFQKKAEEHGGTENIPENELDKARAASWRKTPEKRSDTPAERRKKQQIDETRRTQAEIRGADPGARYTVDREQVSRKQALQEVESQLQEQEKQLRILDRVQERKKKRRVQGEVQPTLFAGQNVSPRQAGNALGQIYDTTQQNTDVDPAKTFFVVTAPEQEQESLTDREAAQQFKALSPAEQFGAVTTTLTSKESTDLVTESLLELELDQEKLKGTTFRTFEEERSGVQSKEEAFDEAVDFGHSLAGLGALTLAGGALFRGGTRAAAAIDTGAGAAATDLGLLLGAGAVGKAGTSYVGSLAEGNPEEALETVLETTVGFAGFSKGARAADRNIPRITSGAKNLGKRAKMEARLRAADALGETGLNVRRPGTLKELPPNRIRVNEKGEVFYNRKQTPEGRLLSAKDAQAQAKAIESTMRFRSNPAKRAAKDAEQVKPEDLVRTDRGTKTRETSKNRKTDTKKDTSKTENVETREDAQRLIDRELSKGKNLDQINKKLEKNGFRASLDQRTGQIRIQKTRTKTEQKQEQETDTEFDTVQDVKITNLVKPETRTSNSVATRLNQLVQQSDKPVLPATGKFKQRQKQEQEQEAQAVEEQLLSQDESLVQLIEPQQKKQQQQEQEQKQKQRVDQLFNTRTQQDTQTEQRQQQDQQEVEQIIRQAVRLDTVQTQKQDQKQDQREKLLLDTNLVFRNRQQTRSLFPDFDLSGEPVEQDGDAFTEPQAEFAPSVFAALENVVSGQTREQLEEQAEQGFSPFNIRALPKNTDNITGL